MMDAPRLEEWKALREEIVRKQTFVESTWIAASAASLAAMAFGLKESSTEGIAICLLPTILTSIVYFWILTRVYSGFRIANYIKTVIEPDIAGLNWENWLSDFVEKKNFRLRNPYSMLVSAMYGFSLTATLVKVIILHTQDILEYSLILSAVVVLAVWGLWILGIHGLLISPCLKDIKNVLRDVDAD
jgi:hypothetical protein